MSLMDIYNAVKQYAGEDIVPHWQKVNEHVLNDILLAHNEDFLRDPLFAVNTFADHPESTRYLFQLDYIFENWDEDLARAILEDEPWFGNAPRKELYDMWISPNSVQHLYHLIYWQVETGKDLREITSVVEWGGGYGNLARLFHCINPNAKYLIIDTPVYLTLQYWYLTKTIDCSVGVMGILDNNQFHLAPAGLFPPLISHDMFISTWALSESDKAAMIKVSQDLSVCENDNVLIAFQDTNELFASASDVVSILNDRRENKIENVKQVDYLSKGNYYAVK